MSSFLKIKYYKLKGLVSLKINSTIFKKIVPHRPFLPTANALIDYRNEVMNLSFSNMILELNMFNIYKQARNQEDEDNENKDIELIESIINDHFQNENFTNFMKIYFANSFESSKELECYNANLCVVLDSTTNMHCT